MFAPYQDRYRITAEYDDSVRNDPKVLSFPKPCEQLPWWKRWFVYCLSPQSVTD